MIFAVIFVVLLIMVALYGVSIYNRLVRLRTLVQEAWSGIDVLLKRRHDLIPNLVETVKGYATHERASLEAVVSARTQAANASTLPEKQAAETSLQNALVNLNAVAEQYPDLKANTNFQQLQSELAAVETDLEKARRYYNGTVRENNILVETFPSNIVANMGGFSKSPFFELEDIAERAVPQVKF